MGQCLFLILPPWKLILYAMFFANGNHFIRGGVALQPIVVSKETVEATSNNSNIDDDTHKFEKLVAWVRHNGGRVDDRLSLANHRHGNRVIRGGVALQPIEAGTELLFIPWKIVLGTIVGDTATVPKNLCEVFQNYASEVEKGTDSFWFPYLSLDDSLSTVGRVPSLWNELAISELQGLPPYGRTAGLTDWFSLNCAEGVTFSNLPESTRQSLLAAITRAAGMRFLPIYDLFNHHNGLLNTKSHANEKGTTITITKNIAEGAEIFLSYRGGTDNTVSEVYRRYGFVEPWPQYWSWTDRGDKDGSTVSTIQFLLLPNNVVIIYPPDRILSQIGESVLHLEDFLASAEEHNQRLSTEELVRFRRTGQALLSSLTTTEEDIAILYKMEQHLSRQVKEAGNTIETEQLSDQISAVDYRIHFKAAIQVAIRAAGNVLTFRGEDEL